jgi:CubicO group peptidase (beta-lactamase class C family)
MPSMQEQLASLDDFINRAWSDSNIPGLAVGIVQGGKLVHATCIGKANIALDQEVSPSTAFRLASISKSVTTVGLLQLWEEGKFQLDDPVNMYLPKGKVIVKRGWPEVTFAHLLTHQAGIGEIMQKRDLLKPGYGLLVTGHDTPVPPLRTIHDKPLKPEVPAGTKYAYSNIGFSLLGYLIEQLAGKPFHEYITTSVLDPLGMVHSDFFPAIRIGSGEAAGYKRSFNKIVPATYYQNIIAPAGNLISSINDMALFTSMLLGKGVLPGGKQLLKASTIEMAFEPRYWAHESLKDDASIGLCFHIYNINGTRIVEHTGATSGFTSAMSLVPSENLGVLVFSNMDEIFGARRTLEIKHEILGYLLGNDVKKNATSIVGTSVAKKAIGYYGPLPGVLTNIRILGYYGGDFKIHGPDTKLFLSSFYGKRRRGIEMIPSADGKQFTLPSLSRPKAKPEHAALLHDENGNVSGLALDLYKLRKNVLANTLRFKVVVIALSLALTLCLLAVFLSTM